MKMTLRDMSDAGIQIMGNIIIRIWDEDKNDYSLDMHIEGHKYESLVAYLKGNEDLVDMEIKYTFPMSDFDNDDDVVAWTVYELEPKGEDE